MAITIAIIMVMVSIQKPIVEPSNISRIWILDFHEPFRFLDI